MNIILYRKILDEQADRTRAYFRDHARYQVNILQKPEKYREDFDLYKPEVILVDWALANERRQALLGRLRKLDEAVLLGVSIPDFLGDGVLAPLRDNDAVQFVVPITAGNTELELTFRFLEKFREQYLRAKAFEGKYNGIIDEFNAYRANLAVKDEAIQKLERHIGDILTFDPLTGMSNERHFHQQMRILLDECRRYKENLCLAYLSIDNREQIEEVYGKEGVESVIKDTADLIRHTVRNNDLVGIRDDRREYMVCYKKIRMESVRVVVGRLKKNLEDHIYLHQGKQIRVTASIGLASTLSYTVSTFEFDQLVQNARTAFENALKKGGNVMVAYA
ncbi:MAG: GGDEF domain-containing protein [Spirochaetes bacterium]|nr:GGDEF domain-containing protein [Spirochaetota bacterium]